MTYSFEVGVFKLLEFDNEVSVYVTSCLVPLLLEDKL